MHDKYLGRSQNETLIKCSLTLPSAILGLKRLQFSPLETCTIVMDIPYSISTLTIHLFTQKKY